MARCNTCRLRIRSDNHQCKSGKPRPAGPKPDRQISHEQKRRDFREMAIREIIQAATDLANREARLRVAGGDGNDAFVFAVRWFTDTLSAHYATRLAARKAASMAAAVCNSEDVEAAYREFMAVDWRAIACGEAK